MAWLRGLVLMGLLASLAGCGGGSSSGPAPDTGHGTSSGTTADTRPITIPPPDPHEMDPTKHVIPPGDVRGRLESRVFNPDKVELVDGGLVFRQGKDFFADLEVKITLKTENGKPVLPQSHKIAPSQKWTEGLPTITTGIRSGQDLPKNEFITEGYALTLELGPREKGRVKGKVYLALPGAGSSYLAGIFDAEWVRGFSAPPEREDAPYLKGKVTHPGKKGDSVTVGYVALTNEPDPISDRIGLAAGSEGAVQSATHKPRLATLRCEDLNFQYDFTKLPPGQYVVYARLANGPSMWVKTEVKPDAELTLDLAIEASKTGTVEAKLPMGQTFGLRLAPDGLGIPDPNGLLSSNLGFALELEAKPQGGKVVIANVPVGKYVLLPAEGTLTPLGTVEVQAGKTASVEVMAPKK